MDNPHFFLKKDAYSISSIIMGNPLFTNQFYVSVFL